MMNVGSDRLIAVAGNVFAIAAGGGLGALVRYGVTLLMTQTPVSRFISGFAPSVGGGASFGMTVANLSGCFLLGGLYQFAESAASMGETPIDPRWMLAIRVGFLGSLTTFSTLMGDVVVLGSSQRIGTSLTLLSVNLVGGAVLFLIAIAIVRSVTP